MVTFLASAAGRRGSPARPIRSTAATRSRSDPHRPASERHGADAVEAGRRYDSDTMETVDDVRAALAEHDYLADEGLATAIFLALRLQRPLLLEGEAGVGKTEVAKVLARWTGGELVRLQCYEGIDAAPGRLRVGLLAPAAAPPRGRGERRRRSSRTSSTPSASSCSGRCCARSTRDGVGVPPVLLVDEVDRADDEFEAFLLEILSDYTITVPELGTFRAEVPPIVVLTSNRTRDVHDALKRRCLYHWIAHPDFERELAILRVRAPEVPEALARQVAAAVEALRELELYKPPGVAETIDWAQALAALGAHRRSTSARSTSRSARSSSTARTRSACAAHGLERARRRPR